jgi:hypothetical protein
METRYIFLILAIGILLVGFCVYSYVNYQEHPGCVDVCSIDGKGDISVKDRAYEPGEKLEVCK